MAVSVDELERLVRSRLKQLAIKVGYRSLVAETGVALAGIRDVVSCSIEVAGIFTDVSCALVWIENGAGASLGVALMGAGEGLSSPIVTWG